MKKFITAKEVKGAYKKALKNAQEKKNYKNIEAFGFALKVGQNLPNDLMVKIEETRTGYNIGVWVEIAVKYYLQGGDFLEKAKAGENDINRATMNEVKAFANPNRRANGLQEPQGFIAVEKNGAYSITKEMVERHWDKLGNSRITRRQLRDVIEIEKPNRLKGLSEWLGL